MKKRIGILASAACITVAVTALAGNKSVDEVSISGTAGSEITVSGSMGSARASSDNLQMIGCRVNAYSTDTTVDTTCFGRDSTGRLVTCESQSPAFAQAASAITSDSHIQFTTGGLACDSLFVEANSRFLPKTP
jgi:hypothetical protein